MSRKTAILLFLPALVLVAAGMGAIFHYLDYLDQWVRTNNASIDGRMYMVSAQIPGTIGSIHVTEGMRVEKGAVLATLVPNFQGLWLRPDELWTNTEEALMLREQTKIAAPASGYVAHLQADTGEHHAAGQPLMFIVNLDKLWVRANFSENDIRHIRLGQEVDIRVDAYPDTVLAGRVASILPAAGAVFSLFPPDATAGNWVRVAQRIPVKITIDDNDRQNGLSLRIGMLARVRIRK